MFLRRTTYKMAQDRDTEDGQAAFEKSLRATVRPQDIDGLINTTHVPNEDGTWSVVAIWDSEAQSKVATPRIRAAWKQHAPHLDGPPSIEVGGVTLNETW